MPDMAIVIISIIASVLIYFMGIPYLVKTLGMDKMDTVMKIVKEVVYSIEQTLKDVDGEVKKHEAMKLAKEILNSLKIEIDDKMLDMLIESAVFLMNNTLENNSL
ncbi:MAG: phage holin [Thermoanaerobacteraceae bacterium]|nr:phage holin [Thermoanaerobacteraceae bacterium]